MLGNAGGMIEAMLAPTDAVLFLTSGPLGGLIETVSRMAERKFPR
jgi:hypothetical protein